MSVDMSKEHGSFKAAIPGDDTDSKFSLEYNFALERPSEAAWIYPGFNATHSTQPYYAISKRAV